MLKVKDTVISPNESKIFFDIFNKAGVKTSSQEIKRVYVNNVLVWESAPEYSLTINVVDALTTKAISATIIIRGGHDNKTGGIYETYTSSSSVKLPEGNFTAEIKANGYQTSYTNFIMNRNITTTVMAITTPLTTNQVRIVLTWGKTPSDLDSRLEVSNGITISYQNKSQGNMTLDVDDVDSYGPETITINNVSSSLTYKYRVHDYTNNSSNKGGQFSGAKVTCFTNTDSYSWTSSVNNAGNYWNVFNIVNGQIVPVNTYS